jgi:hypothetical protein
MFTTLDEQKEAEMFYCNTNRVIWGDLGHTALFNMSDFNRLSA